jgi:putative aminopeptidase FrvX
VTRDELARTLGELGALHSPSGVEEAVDAYLTERLSSYGAPRTDTAGNIVLRIEGREPGPLRAVLAHKDEIGAMVKRVEGAAGCAGKLGGSFPWVWGEGRSTCSAATRRLPACCRSGPPRVKESPQREQQDSAGVRWQDAWVETKLEPAALDAAGIRPGTRLVPTVARKAPVRLGPDGEYVAAYAIDDKGAVAGLLDLAARLGSPRHTTELVFTAREEIGCHGARWYARHTDAEAVVAFEVTPVADEYGVDAGPDPVLVVADASGPLDDVLEPTRRRAAAAGVRMRHVARRLRLDASKVLSSGPGPARRLPGVRDREHARIRDRPSRRHRGLREGARNLAGLDGLARLAVAAE